MSLIRLESGKFLVIDTIMMSVDQKQEFDNLTDNGNLIEAGIHSFVHSLFLFFLEFCFFY